ncbi:hypothetical protein [Leisingera aquimarina]|uniref:hypothetical protein n=1 Tax=Leisingera aquimarina TaxID=476529 RepID=UPI00041BE25F|nr:hypothetical protein [Leisingera aquimarina]
MQWIVDNWLILLLGGGMVAMHLFGHGHGGHGRGGRRKNTSNDRTAHVHDTRDARSATDEETATARERPKDDGRA